MTGLLTLAQMQANIALSRGHIVKQEAIIARLTEQGHGSMAADAATILLTMNGHLDTELVILKRMMSETANE